MELNCLIFFLKPFNCHMRAPGMPSLDSWGAGPNKVVRKDDECLWGRVPYRDTRRDPIELRYRLQEGIVMLFSSTLHCVGAS